MKAKSGKATLAPIVWGVFLWIGVPAGLFFAGYNLVGPKIGAVPQLKNEAEKVEKLIANTSAPKGTASSSDPEDQGQIDGTAGPEVEVTVEKSTAKPQRKPRSKSSTGTRKPRASSESGSKPTHVRDDASADGAMPPSDEQGTTGGRG